MHNIKTKRIRWNNLSERDDDYMKSSLLFKFLFTLLIVCSAYFARYVSEHCYKEEAVFVMSQNGADCSRESITFTDLAMTVNSLANGGAKA